VTTVLSRAHADVSALWGFCPSCELWRYSTEWLAAGSDEPACPVCRSAPTALEVLDNGVARVHLILELPPGGDIPLLT
jgi:hypothetical protein